MQKAENYVSWNGYKIYKNGDIIGLYTFKDQRLLHDKFVGKETLEADYQPVAIMEIEL